MVLSPVRQGNKYLICRQGVNGSGGGTGDVCAAEDDLYFVRITGVHDDLAVNKRTGEKVDAFVHDGDL